MTTRPNPTEAERKEWLERLASVSKAVRYQVIYEAYLHGLKGKEIADALGDIKRQRVVGIIGEMRAKYENEPVVLSPETTERVQRNLDAAASGDVVDYDPKAALKRLDEMDTDN